MSESDFAISYVDIVGYAAALAVLGSFCMSTIVPLRILAVVSNVLFGLYGVLADLYPVFFLHCLSRWAALLTGLVFAVPTLGPTIAEAQADLSDAANLYPGRYAAVCTPAPMFGCVCTRDPRGEALMFTELDSTADHHLTDIEDTEYLRMIAWLRRTCASLTQSVVPP